MEQQRAWVAAEPVATVGRRPRIVIVGGGFVGFTVARTLAGKLRAGEADVVLIDGTGVMTYQPFLPEVAAGLIEPRHLVIPLRQVLHSTRVVTGWVTAIDRERQRVRVELPDGTGYDEPYDELVLAPGAVPRTRPIPGLADHAIGFGTLTDAEYLRDRVLTRIALAADTDDWETFRRALTFVVIGGGYSGVELIAELQSMARAAIRRHPTLKVRDMRWELIEAADEIMPELPAKLGRYARRRLAGSGISVRVNTQVEALSEGRVTLVGGEQFGADTVVWTAGVRANPLLAQLGLPVDARGRLRCDPTLRVQGDPRLWSAGDGAAVPDLAARPKPGQQPGRTGEPLCGPTAQHAVRQAKRLARNIIGALRGRESVDYRHPDAGSVASLGLHRGVARIYGVPLRGLPAWLLHRGYHLMMVPTWGRRIRVAVGWFAALLGRRDLAPLPVPVRPPYLSAGAAQAGRIAAEPLDGEASGTAPRPADLVEVRASRAVA